jgi:hypothetical protein
LVTANVPDFNHHKGAKTLRTPSISKLFLSLWLRVFVVFSRATLVVTISDWIAVLYQSKSGAWLAGASFCK